jgi:AbrB family looped-hinge helix DNA binding protein
MRATIDSVGRILIPKQLRDALGFAPGSDVDISPYGSGLAVLPGGRTARIMEKDGFLVAEGSTPLTDEIMYALIDAGRK